MNPTSRLRSAPERRRVLLGALGALAGAAWLAAGPGAFHRLAAARGLETRTRAGLAFGTTVSLTIAGASGEALDAAITDGFHALRGVEAAGSLFRPESALSRLNRDGALAAPDPLLVTMLRFALDLADLTGGAFDPTVQPLWTLWAGKTARGERPTDSELSEAVSRVGWRGILMEADGIRLAAPGMGVTLNALIQGFAADRVMAAIEARGIAHAFIDTGEFGARGGHPDGTPWRLGLADPRAPDRLARTIAPFTGFAATSGDYAMSFSPDHADHHIFDPKSGRSPRAFSSVTVTAPSGLLADGLSTAAFVLGDDERHALMARYAECRIITTAKDA